MSAFIFIHGAWHGAWCWDDVIPLLTSYGHTGSAIDLPGGGSDPTPIDGVTLDAYVERAVDTVRASHGPVWLVGHSLGGMTITQAAEVVPERIEGLVYVSAYLPLNGQSTFDLTTDEFDGATEDMLELNTDGSASIPTERQREFFYHCCTEEQIDKAGRLLRDRQAMTPAITSVATTAERWGRVPRFYIECLQDRAIPIARQRRMQAAAGVRGVVTLDTDHSPFFSCPYALVAALQEFALTA